MDIGTAIDLINDGIVFLPGWTFHAEDISHRFEGTVKLRISYHAVDTGRDNAKIGYEKELDTFAEFSFPVANCPDINSVVRHMLDKIMEIQLHEAREALRIRPSYDAPFHPHALAGMAAYGKVDTDLSFGVA